MNGQEPLRTGLVGSVLALCCITKTLILSGTVGLPALAVWPAAVLLLAVVTLAGIAIYALWRKHPAT